MVAYFATEHGCHGVLACFNHVGVVWFHCLWARHVAQALYDELGPCVERPSPHSVNKCVCTPIYWALWWQHALFVVVHVPIFKVCIEHRFLAAACTCCLCLPWVLHRSYPNRRPTKDRKSVLMKYETNSSVSTPFQHHEKGPHESMR